MVSSSFITSVNSALDDLDFLILDCPFSYGELYESKEQRYRLTNLKAFALCARKLSNDVHQRSNDNKNEDGSLGSLLIRIEDAVGRYAQQIRSFRLKLENKLPDVLKTDIQPLKGKIDEWYITMSVYTRQSSSLTADEIVEITESIPENHFPFLRFREPMDALQEHVKFLRNFCRFVTRSGVEHGQIEDLLTHTEVVAINASHLCFLCEGYLGGSHDFGNKDEEWRKGMQFKISTLLQKIKPIDCQVYKTYNQALSCSKCLRRLHAPTQDMDDDSTIVMKNFVDSLIYILWDTLRQDADHVFSLKDHWQVLYEGLRSLRTTLKKLPNNIDEKTRDVIRAVVSDAGVLICSFYHKNVETDLGLKDLLERMKPFLAKVEEKVPQTSIINSPRIKRMKRVPAKVEEKVPQTSIFNSPRINELDFFDFLLENLMELAHDKVEPVVKSHVQTIREELLYLRTFLEETVNSRALWNRVLEALYRLEFLIDHLAVGDISNSFSMEFDSVMEDLQTIKADDALKNFYGKREDIKVKEVTRTYSHVLSQKTDSMTTEVVGFRDEAKSIMDRLTRGSKQLKVIAVMGMGGLGKTTLATKVYNDPLVVHHFHVRAWRPVSQTLDKKALLLELLTQFHLGTYSEMTEDDLAEKVRRHLKGRRYLIFLDDIWTIEAWNSLKGSFPDDSTGSRIILTSRNLGTAPLDMLDQEPHFLRQLNKDESLELLQRKLFPGKVWPPALYDLGMQIAELCKGLPLTIVIVAGFLAATVQEGWKKIVDGLSSGIVSSTEQCMNTLELSYKHLPNYLKPCFLYFGAFPEDEEVSVRRLIRLWIAEGFVRKSKSKSLEDVAEDYMMDLIGRSLIMVAQKRSIGGVKSCHIHDLLHDFCLKKAKDEYFFHWLKGHDELLAFNEPCNLRRLCIRSEQEHFKESKLFCPRARSLRFFSQIRGRHGKVDISFVIHIFKLVRVLDLGEIYFGTMFPSEIELLVQLRYLSIRGFLSVIPSSIGSLSMLETLIVDPGMSEVTLPDTIWNLQKLKYVFICRDVGFGGGSFPIKNLDKNSVLYELDRISGALFFDKGRMEKQMRMFPNIRKLECMLREDWDDAEEFQNIVVPDFLSRLESLHMSLYRKPPENIKIEFCLPANLKKLTLGYFGLPWSKISTIGKLPNLEVLKLLHGSFRGKTLEEKTWEMEEGEFPKLRYLKLVRLNIVRWTASDDQFPCLQKLVLEDCFYLEEVPCCLESTPTLEMIEVFECTNATRSLLEHIEEQQEKSVIVSQHMQEAMNDLGPDIAALAERCQQNAARLEKGVKDLNEGVNRLNARVAKLEHKGVKRVAKQTAKLDARVDKLEAKIRRLQNAMGNDSEEVGTVSEVDECSSAVEDN